MPDTRQPITNFTRATKQKAAAAVAIAGSSGSGKTKTALEIATGLAGPEGTIGFIDTEGRRALHYARQYRFDHCDFSEGPFSPARCTQAIAEAHEHFDVVVFDSFSDEWEGVGGMLDMAEAEGAWIKTKNAHKDTIIRYIRRRPLFTIFCLRAEEKVKFEKVNGKLHITPQGWMPICEKRFMYDMTLSLTLSPETPGLPRFDLPRKISDDFKPFFAEGRLIDRTVGEGLRKWALDVDGLPPPEDKAKPITDALIALVNKATSEEALAEALTGEKEAKQVKALKERRPDELERLNKAIAEKRAALAGGGAL